MITLAGKLLLGAPTPSLRLNLRHDDPVGLSVSRALATATAQCFAETDNEGASLQPIILPANKARYYRKRWGASTSSWSDTYADGTAIEESFLRGAYSEIASANLALQSDDISNAFWVKHGTASAVDYKTLSLPASGDYINQTSTFNTTKDATLSLIMSGTGTISIEIVGISVDVATTTTLTAIPTKYEYHSQASNLPSSVRIGRRTAGTCTSLTISNIQCEALPMSSSTIPTTTATATRNADVLTFPNAGNVSDAVGTLIMEVMPAFNIPNGTVAGYGKNWLLDFGADKGLYIESQTLKFTDGTNTATLAWIPLKDTAYKIAAKWGLGELKIAVNGVVSSGVSFDGAMNTGVNMTIGGSGGGATYNWGGFIGLVELYKKALSDAKIAAKTA